MVKLSTYLAEIATNKDLSESIKNDKESALGASGLSSEHIELLKSGDQHAIAQALSAELGAQPLGLGVTIPVTLTISL